MAIYRNKVGAIANPTTQFYSDVMEGLSASPKYLHSKYFYDAAGDRLFQDIMDAPEYYLTRSEMEIFTLQTPAIAEAIMQKLQAFDIIELGAGDAVKSSHLLKHLKDSGAAFTYYPVDISVNIIHLLEKEMPKRITGMEVKGLNGEYMEMVAEAYRQSNRSKLVLFLGSSIGNFSKKEARQFLHALHAQLRPRDLLLTGFDLKKDPYQVLAAYNDKAGITRAFNLNLLKRINRELGGDFNLTCFQHYPTYDPITGACRSYLISTREQQVHIGDTEVISFYKDEPVYMELSQKYSLKEIASMASGTGYLPLTSFTDVREWFVDDLWQRV